LAFIGVLAPCFITRQVEAAATVPTQSVTATAALCSGVASGGAAVSCSIGGVSSKEIHISNIALTGEVGPTYAGGCADVSVTGLAAGTLYFRWCLLPQSSENQLIVPFTVPVPSALSGGVKITVGTVGDANSLIGIAVTAAVY
jgi:hypothetical protein